MTPVDFVEVRGKKVNCCEIDINDNLDCKVRTQYSLAEKIKTQTLEDLKRWLAPLLSVLTPLWIEEGATIEKKIST